jgi:hypothetical protein
VLVDLDGSAHGVLLAKGVRRASCHESTGRVLPAVTAEPLE